jgi:zinc and cadmium transporter
MAVTLGAFCTAIVIVSVLGGILPLATVLNHTRLQVYLSFSAGTMLGAAFFHMLPEAVRLGSGGTLRWSAVGLLALFFLERFFSFHHHETSDPDPTPLAVSGKKSQEARTIDPDADHDHGQVHNGDVSSRVRVLPWGSAAFGLAVHSLVGGIALASAVVADYQVGQGIAGASLGVFIATFVHKPADALTISALMVRAGSTPRYTHLVNLGFALMIPVGVALFWLGTGGIGSISPGAWTAGALAFSAGTFLCIALSDLLPELQFHSHDRFKLSAALLAGFALMAGTAVFEPAGDHDVIPAHQRHQAGRP